MCGSKTAGPCDVRKRNRDRCYEYSVYSYIPHAETPAVTQNTRHTSKAACMWVCAACGVSRDRSIRGRNHKRQQSSRSVLLLLIPVASRGCGAVRMQKSQAQHAILLCPPASRPLLLCICQTRNLFGELRVELLLSSIHFHTRVLLRFKILAVTCPRIPAK